MSFVVIVGSVGDKEGAGLHVHGTFRNRGEAEEFANDAEKVFAEAVKTYGDKAFPYGEPFAQVEMLFGATDALSRYTDGTKAGENWVYNPDLADAYGLED